MNDDARSPESIPGSSPINDRPARTDLLPLQPRLSQVPLHERLVREEVAAVPEPFAEDRRALAFEEAFEAVGRVDFRDAVERTGVELGGRVGLGL